MAECKLYYTLVLKINISLKIVQYMIMKKKLISHVNERLFFNRTLNFGFHAKKLFEMGASILKNI